MCGIFVTAGEYFCLRLSLSIIFLIGDFVPNERIKWVQYRKDRAGVDRILHVYVMLHRWRQYVKDRAAVSDPACLCDLAQVETLCRG